MKEETGGPGHPERSDVDAENDADNTADQLRHYVKVAAENAGKCVVALDMIIEIAQRDLVTAGAVTKFAALAKCAKDVELELWKLREGGRT